MFQIHSWPNVILHLDGDAFFASVMQATNPELKGKPVVTGCERGIATAVSYEAKRLGVKRGMRIFEIKNICPRCLILTSDYEAYQLFSQKMFAILRSLTGEAEEYSIDEGFADLKGLRRPLNASYSKIGKMVKDKIESSLGITVSVGISVTKSLAKLASSANKPSGLTIVDGRSLEKLLEPIPVREIWGVGENTAAYLNKLGIQTALEFASQKEDFIKKNFSKPYFEIWQELRGEKVYELNCGRKAAYKSMMKSQTFSPPTSDAGVLWAKLSDQIEKAFEKARRFNYRVGEVNIFLKTQDFNYHATKIKLPQASAYPLLIRTELKEGFTKIYRQNILYRATGCYLGELKENKSFQTSLFGNQQFAEEKAKKIYALYEEKKVDFGARLFDKAAMVKERSSKRFGLPFLSFRFLA
ncbi:DNA polymerase IV [Candidatus Shapirobacteria bacterium]|nr:DNA polymerase IV [Candidatus Shapirobacteria bacterium]